MDTTGRAVNIRSRARRLFVNMRASARRASRRDRPPPVPSHVPPTTTTPPPHLCTSSPPGVNGGVFLQKGDFNSILTRWICLRSTRGRSMLYAICYRLPTPPNLPPHPTPRHSDCHWCHFKWAAVQQLLQLLVRLWHLYEIQ